MLRMLVAFVAVLASVGGVRSARADVIDDIALRVFLGFRLFNDDSALGNKEPGQTSIGNSAVIGIRGEYEFTEWLAVEGEVPATLTGSRDDLANLLFFDPRAHARLSLPTLAENRIRPFFTLGLGVPIVLSDNRTGLESDILGEFYGGAAIAIEPRVGSLAFRLDVRVEALQARGNQALTPEVEVLATVYRATPNRWQRAAMPATDTKPGEPPPPPDRDNDGIPDDRDQCPDRDEDKDKFEDEDGCPDIDNDYDSVLDIADRCPTEREILNGFQDDDGCADEMPSELIRLEGVVGVTFASGTAQLAGDSFAILRQAAKVLVQYPSVRIEVGGHTDDQGDETANQALSQARADAVVEFLTLQGVDRGRLRPVGYGPFSPIADNSSPAGRLKNRRVEFRVIRPKLPKASAPTP